MKHSRCVIALLGTVFVMFASYARAVIFYDYGNDHNTVAPAGVYTGSGWQWQGNWGSGGGATIVSPTQILTVGHYSAGTFYYGGNSYGFVSDVTFGDMRLVTVNTSLNGEFTSWAPLYNGSGEVGELAVLHGRGRGKDGGVSVSGESKGWEWDGINGPMRWGTNTLEFITGGAGQYVGGYFDAVGTTHEAQIVLADSGSGMFIYDDGEWKLAGVNYGSLYHFSYDGTSGTKIWGAIYDRGGLYEWDGAAYQYVPDQSYDIPAYFFTHRVSYYYDWLMENLNFPPVVVPEPSSLILLTGALTLFTFRRKTQSRVGFLPAPREG